MLTWLFEGIGALSRDIVEGADSTFETAKEVAADTVDEITSIPDSIAKGYSEGFISNGDTPDLVEGDKGFIDPEVQAS